MQAWMNDEWIDHHWTVIGPLAMDHGSGPCDVATAVMAIGGDDGPNKVSLDNCCSLNVDYDTCSPSPSSPSSRITVRVQILKHLPIHPADADGSGRQHHTAHAHTPRHHGSKRRYASDEHATVYIEPSLSSSNGVISSFLNGGWAACRLIRAICTGYDDNFHSDEGDNLIRWAPVILKRLPLHYRPVSRHADDFDQCDLTPSTIGGVNHNNSTININDEDQIPTLFIPPCLAATMGLHNLFYTQHQKQPYSILAFLQHLPTTEIANASHATLREIGRPPPNPILSWPSTSSTISSDTGSSNEEKQLRNFFLYPSSTTNIAGIQTSSSNESDKNAHYTNTRPLTSRATKTKPRQRLLALGSIFAVPSSDRDNMDDDVIACETYDKVERVGGEEDIGNVIENVRFYQVMDIQCSRQGDGGGTIRKPSADGDYAEKRIQNMMAYIVSPFTQLVLLPPPSESADSDEMTTHSHMKGGTMMRGYDLRLPRPSVVIDFLRSVSLKRVANYGTFRYISNVAHHPSAQALADAIYLQGTSSSTRSTIQRQCHVCRNKLESTLSYPTHVDADPRIIHIIGKEENHIRACVDEAADIMGMRSFHVEGLAAFWAHYSLFNTYSRQNYNNASVTPQLTGALPDKLRGLSASLDIARRSSPCVLHVVDVDHELSAAEGHAADLDTRKDEERRILEAIRAGGSFNNSPSLVGCDRIMTTAPVIVVLSTSCPLPSGPISSSLLQSSIEIAAPDVSYARLLWDNDVDGTFECLSSNLIGLSANEIIYLRERFNPCWKEVGGNEQCSPLDILQSLLPQLETRRSFMQSSVRKGSSSTLPLSSSSIPNVRWEDIGGLDSIRKEIMDAVELPLKYPHYFAGSRRSGILLFGPPGTGKTLVAKAVARECGLPFLSIKGPELLGSYVGESEANIRAVFDAARSAAMTPVSSSLTVGLSGASYSGGYSGASILFFDEIDSLAPRRGNTGHGDGVMDRVVATLLSELDSGGDGGGRHGKRESRSAHVVVIGATNRPDLLDPSLLRPGRFDRLLYLGPAKTREHCLKILLAQTRKFRFEEGCDAETVLKSAMEAFPPTLSGADLSAVASGALMRGLKRVCDRIEEEARSTNLERGVDEGTDNIMAIDVDDVMESWPEEKLQPVLTADDFVEAAKDIVPSISSADLERFEELQRQFSSGQFS